MLTKTRAIVLQNTPYSESSVISKMYTREFGLRSYLISGVRKSKSNISPAIIQPLSLLNMDVYEKAGANIQRIKELKTETLLIDISSDFRKRTVALFLIEILNACLHAENGEEGLYDFLEEEILQLEKGKQVSNFPLFFLMKFAAQLGIEPQGVHSTVAPYFNLENGSFEKAQGKYSVNEEISKVIYWLKLWLREEKHLSLSPELRSQTLNELVLYYRLHVLRNREIHSLAVLTEVMEAWHNT